MTSEKLLSNIKIIAGRKQMFSSQVISIDTLVLGLRISEAELLPLIEELSKKGIIEYHPAPSQRYGLGTISLIDRPNN